MAYQCNGLCNRYSITRRVSKNKKSLYESGYVRCSACSVVFSIMHTKTSRNGGKCCMCCGCRVRARPHSNFRRKVMPAISTVKKIKLG